MKYIIATALALILASTSAFAFPYSFQGQVIRIADGDTLTVLNGQNQQVKIRISGIDAPEKSQAFGNKSRQSLASLCFRQKAIVNVHKKDRYGRSVSDISCNGHDVAHHQVRSGLAWVYDKYSKGHEYLYPIQEQAKSAKRGLWRDPHPIPPWQYRHPDAGDRPIPNQQHHTSTIIGNRNSHTYHIQGVCPDYGKISKRNAVPFNSEQDALSAGYHRSKNCGQH